MKTLARRSLCDASVAGYIHIGRIDVVAIGISDRSCTQPLAVHAPVVLLAAGIVYADKELTAARRDAAAQVLELEVRVEHVTVAAAESAGAFQKQVRLVRRVRRVRCTVDGTSAAAAVWCVLRAK